MFLFYCVFFAHSGALHPSGGRQRVDNDQQLSLKMMRRREKADISELMQTTSVKHPCTVIQNEDIERARRNSAKYE